MTEYGVFSRAELLAQYTPHEIDAFVADGLLLKINRGWYALDVVENKAVTAVRNQTRIGCLSGCDAHGLWVPPFRGNHLVYGNGRKPRLGPDYILHHSSAPLPASAVYGLADCITHVLRNHDAETGLIVADSAMNLDLLTNTEIAAIIRGLPQRVHAILPYLAWAQSGSETRARYLFQRMGVKVRTQVEIDGVGRVDLVVGDCLVVECDSKRHHSSQTSYERDRRRDLAARDLGFTVTRLSYRQIWDEWEATQQSIIRQIRDREHRANSRQRARLASTMRFHP